ncbi:MAG TPA: GNAT family N-acetyltransferase [Mycobacteriales bacterium]|nr:GNAT family N-acetyltransferase [Mycobacteriales bacterium]
MTARSDSIFASTVLGTVAFRLRRAVAGDVPEIVQLLAADQLGATRDNVADRDLTPYLRAFDAITADPAHLLVVAVAGGEQVVGTLQLSVLPGLARRGAFRAQIEAVRVHEAHRACGVGTWMLGWAVEWARRQGCGLVQLTSDKRRTDAHRFYERHGFVNSHDGFKRFL